MYNARRCFYKNEISSKEFYGSACKSVCSGVIGWAGMEIGMGLGAPAIATLVGMANPIGIMVTGVITG